MVILWFFLIPLLKLLKLINPTIKKAMPRVRIPKKEGFIPNIGKYARTNVAAIIVILSKTNFKTILIFFVPKIYGARKRPPVKTTGQGRLISIFKRKPHRIRKTF